MTRVYRDGVLRCPLITVVDPDTVYDLPIVLTAWKPEPLDPEKLRALSIYFGDTLTYVPPLCCISHEHAARIDGFRAEGKKLLARAEQYLAIVSAAFRLDLSMEFEDPNRRWVPQPSSHRHLCALR